jgi:type IV pilus assembly protein PilY1
MRKRNVRNVRTCVVASSFAALLSVPAPARAQQVDTNPPLPDVLLMLDNSGSMERMIDGTVPEARPGNACNCTDDGTGALTCNWSSPPAGNRWNTVQQILTGSLQNGFNCVAMSRASGSTFAQEYQIGGVAPYDVNYYLAYHRMVANDKTSGTPVPCVIAPGSLPGAPSAGGVGPVGVSGSGAGGSADGYTTGTSIVSRQYGKLPPKATSCTFAQYQDGAIPSMSLLMRFGLMMFDQDPSPATGVSTGPPFTVNSSPFAGMWTYYPGWQSQANCNYLGNPANCSTQSMMAVGARNPAAPPWEGRLVYFPSKSDIALQQTNNQTIQSVILASRAYGATPMAGMFAGAQYFFWTDPKGPQQTDSFVQGGCRNEYIILLTDGAPNLDLQPACSAAGSPPGVCPFPLPQTTAATLYNNGQPTGSNQFVKTYVIGFAVSAFQDQGSLVKCSDFAKNGALASQCNCADPSLPQQQPQGACCELQCIAQGGGTSQAYFADTQGDLTNALNSILADIAKNATTRTVPAFSASAANVVADPNTPQTNSSIYFASFNPSPGQPWSGDIQRQRYVCTYQGSGFTLPTPTITKSLGDDFAANLNSHAGPARTFIAFQPDVEADNVTVDPTATIRPYVSTGVGDKLGKYSATTYSGSGGNVVSAITAPALGPSCAGGYTYTTTKGTSNSMNANLCETMLLDYLFGQQSFAGAPGDFSFVSRYNNALGAVFHATPAVVGAPGSLLQDALYAGFRSTWANRQQVLYAATNDGLLHAFWADAGELKNNELWAMAPPAIMAKLGASYPSRDLFLLDGSPVVKDVVWDRPLTGTDSTAWHTMLVAGFGPSQPGYYAVDVTNPDASKLGTKVVPTDPAPPGPVFLWQLTTLPSSSYQIFGKQSSSTPAITTLFVDPGDKKGAREIGVAILPGGQDGPAPTPATACGRQTVAKKASDSAPPNDFGARTSVRCWGKSLTQTDPVNGRSLSVVRLDTGEILRVFARAADVPSTDSLGSSNANRIIDTPLDSPMTGTPMVFPVDVGSDATKVFVGDADGTIWRFDLSSSDPSQWFGELYLDLYNQKVDTNTNSWTDGQPIEVTPVISLDPAGQVVLNVASGTTQQFDTSGQELLYSVTEKVQGSPPKLRAFVNWWLGPPGTYGTPVFQPGERVSGPMTVFNGTLYFATYYAGATGTNSCNGGIARLWGRDFVTPDNLTDLSQGGVRILQPPPPNKPLNPPPTYIQPSDYDPPLLGKVIPGVSIKATPACGSLGLPGADQYVAGATHQSPNNFAPGSFSLFSPVGMSGTNGAAVNAYELPLATPTSPTVIDSWAAVVE